MPSAKSIQGFESQITVPADSCQCDSQLYGYNFNDEILKEYPEELRARWYTLKKKVISL